MEAVSFLGTRLNGAWRDFGYTPVFITLVNQTSIVSIQVPDPLCSDDVKKYLDAIADYLQKTLSAI